jgi:hypothetical protein
MRRTRSFARRSQSAAPRFSPLGDRRGKTRAESLQCGNVRSGSKVRISLRRGRQPYRRNALKPDLNPTHWVQLRESMRCHLDPPELSSGALSQRFVASLVSRVRASGRSTFEFEGTGNPLFGPTMIRYGFTVRSATESSPLGRKGRRRQDDLRARRAAFGDKIKC